MHVSGEDQTPFSEWGTCRNSVCRVGSRCQCTASQTGTGHLCVALTLFLPWQPQDVRGLCWTNSGNLTGRKTPSLWAFWSRSPCMRQLRNFILFGGQQQCDSSARCVRMQVSAKGSICGGRGVPALCRAVELCEQGRPSDCCSGQQDGLLQHSRRLQPLFQGVLCTLWFPYKLWSSESQHNVLYFPFSPFFKVSFLVQLSQKRNVGRDGVSCDTAMAPQSLKGGWWRSLHRKSLLCVVFSPSWYNTGSAN